MTGLCCVVGRSPSALEWLADGLDRGDRRTRDTFDGRIQVAVSSHRGSASAGDQPAQTVGSDVRAWVWGEVFGFEGPQGYVPIHERDGEAARFCCEQYRRFGRNFVSRLNGTFAGIIYDAAEGDVHLFTDRLGSHPVYFTRTTDGTPVFSTHIQSLATAPGVETSFDSAALGEYLSVGRISGIRTAFTDVEEIHPGTVMTVDIDAGETTTDRYWTPRYRPIDRPFSYFVDQFTETIQTVISERVADDDNYGVLLSGGSDSRLLLAAIPPDVDVSTYHMSDWMSPEATTAEKVAATAERPFEWLRRSDDHHRRALDANAGMMNFYGRFDESKTTGFEDRLQESTDILLSGLYADSLFSDLTFRTPKLPLGPFGTLSVPVDRAVDTPREFIEWKARPLPPFFTGSSLESTLRDGLRPSGDGYEYHGVHYESLRDLATLCEFYPLSNDPDLFYYGLTQTTIHWTPFLDNRLVDLSLSMPAKYKLRRNIVDRALSRLDPTLAEIPHAATGVPVRRSFPLQYIGTQLTALYRRSPFSDDPPDPRYGYGPWTPLGNLLRHDTFSLETLAEYRPLVEALPFLSWEGIIECYRDQLAGGGNHLELFMLLGFLEMPAVRQLVDRQYRDEQKPDLSGIPADYGGNR